MQCKPRSIQNLRHYISILTTRLGPGIFIQNFQQVKQIHLQMKREHIKNPDPLTNKSCFDRKSDPNI